MVLLNRTIRPLTCSIILIAALIFIASMAYAETSGPYAYIVNNGDNTVSVIDTQSNTVIANVTVGNGPTGVAVSADGTRIYVTNANSYLTSVGTGGVNEETGNGTVSVIDAATNTVIATIPLGYMPGGVAVSADGTRIYVVNSDNNTVSVIDAATNTVIATIPVGIMPDGVAVSPDGTKVYVTNWNCSYDPISMSPSPYINGTVSVIDTATDTVTATVPVGNWPWGIGVSPDGTRIYVTNFNNETISAIDAATNTVTATIPLDGTPKGVAVNPAGTTLYVTIGNNVSVINVQTKTVIANVTVGTYPTDVALTPDGTRIYVANAQSNDVSVIDAATNTVTATIPVGNSPSFYGQFIVPAAPTSRPTSSQTPTSISSASATPKSSPFVGVEGIGAIVLGAGLYVMARKRN
jgi:YVTN family beta-propeller protein